ncbi:MAG: hypothetical protein ACYTGK_16380 [Planctomycetota bacterium]
MRRLVLLLALSAAAAADDSELQARTEAECERITRKLEAYLGPKFRRPVPVQLMTKDEMAAFARAYARRQSPPGRIEIEQRLAERMHLVPRGYDMFEKQIEMLKAGVAGLYDPDADRFYVVKGTGSPGTGPFMLTAAHELVHAYRDVDKDYSRRMLAAVEDDTDWAQAIRFLVEGDATFLGQAIGLATMTKRDPAWAVPAARAGAADPDAAMRIARADPKLHGFPLLLRESLVGAYVHGLAFAVRVYDHGGLEALAAAYDRPPRSTEQALHPEKYLGPHVDEPTVFVGGDPTAALGDGWKLALRSVMGEFDMRILFFEALGESKAYRVAAGWDGARFFFSTKPGVAGFIGIISTWDTEEDARQCAAAWALWASRRDGKQVPQGGAGRDATVRTREGLVVVRHEGRDVYVADGVPEERLEPVMRAFASARRGERAADASPLPADD